MRDKAFSLTRGVSSLLRHEKIRFALVGGINTVVDFVIFLILSIIFGFPAIISNIFSTSAALAVSYVLNKKAVFGDSDPNNRQQIILFVVVTLAGLWIIQGAIIIWLNNIFQAVLPELPLAVILVASKIFATIVSLTWNYLWYSRVVFRKGRK